MIEVPGDYLESGGAILRVASALSAVIGKPIHVFNIRKGRSKPGLKTQHLEGLKAVAELCNGKLKGAELGSEEIWLHPGKTQSKELNITVGTAGSLGLVFQSVKLPVSQAESEVKIKIKGGSTFSKWAPPLLFTKNVLLPTLSKMGYKAEIDILKHGFFPVGGSRVKITVYPCERLKPIKLTERGKILGIEGISIASKHLEKARVADRQAKAVAELLKDYKNDIKVQYVESDCPGSGIVLWALTPKGCILGSNSLGERGKKAEIVGAEAANLLKKQLDTGACLDRWMADQCLTFLALADGQSRVSVAEITKHCLTNIWVIEKFLPVKFQIQGSQGKPGIISVKGVDIDSL